MNKSIRLFVLLNILSASSSAKCEPSVDAAKGQQNAEVPNKSESIIDTFLHDFEWGVFVVADMHLGVAACYDTISTAEFTNEVERKSTSHMTRWMLKSHQELKAKQDKGTNVCPTSIFLDKLSSNGTMHPIIWGTSSELIIPKRWRSYEDWKREALPLCGRTPIEIYDSKFAHKLGPVFVRIRALNTPKVPNDRVARARVRVVWEVFDEFDVSTRVVVTEQRFKWMKSQWIKDELDTK